MGLVNGSQLPQPMADPRSKNRLYISNFEMVEMKKSIYLTYKNDVQLLLWCLSLRTGWKELGCLAWESSTSGMLDSFMSTKHKIKSSERRDPHLRKCLHNI